MIPLAFAIEAASMQATALQVAPETCDASAAAAEPVISSAPDCDAAGQTHTLADPAHPLTPSDVHGHHHFHFNPFGIFGHHRHHADRGRPNPDPMAGHEPPVSKISRDWHAQYNAELRATGSDQVPLPEISVRVTSMRGDGIERNVAHVVLPMRNASTMLTGEWQLYRTKDGENRLVLNGTTLEIVATGDRPMARYTISRLLGFRKVNRGVEPITRVTVFEAPIVTDGGAHRGYHVANLRYAIETETVPGE